MRFVLALCGLLLLPQGSSAQSPLLKELAAEDQAARTGGPKPARSDEERVRIVLSLLAKGEVRTAADRFHAGLVLQHTSLTYCDGRLISTSPDNYLLAHHLFAEALAQGHQDARYLVAASLDRYLSFTTGEQKYGTNRLINQKTGKEELVPVDRSTADSERAKYGVPPLAELLRRFPERQRQKH